MRDTTLRELHRRQIKAARPACAICGQPIDYTLPYLDPMSFVVDHIVPVHHGGADTLANKQASHRACNRAKGARLDGGPIIRRSGSLTRPGGGPLSTPK